jgi:hypothetical protein
MSRILDGLRELPGEDEVAYLMGDFIQGKPILPLYCQLPSEYLGVSQFLESNALNEHRGSLYLLERLELVRTLEFRRRYSPDPNFAEFIFVWSQLTPLGLEVYRHCVMPLDEAPASAKKAAKKTTKGRKKNNEAPRTGVAGLVGSQRSRAGVEG